MRFGEGHKKSYWALVYLAHSQSKKAHLSDSLTQALGRSDFMMAEQTQSILAETRGSETQFPEVTGPTKHLRNVTV